MTMTNEQATDARFEVMPAGDALTELRAIGANVKLWSAPRLGARSTIYINGANREKLAEIWCTSANNVNAASVWAAIAKVIAYQAGR